MAVGMLYSSQLHWCIFSGPLSLASSPREKSSLEDHTRKGMKKRRKVRVINLRRTSLIGSDVIIPYGYKYIYIYINVICSTA